jgi:hypothetical protein
MIGPHLSEAEFNRSARLYQSTILDFGPGSEIATKFQRFSSLVLKRIIGILG